MRKVITRIQLFKDPGSAFGNQVEGFLDVKEDAEFPINFSIGDIRDISKRSGSFSKTIKLSGSKNNNILLNNYFEVNVKGSNLFNLNKKQRCAVIQNGVVILDNCYLRLNNTKKVQSNSGHIDELVDYEVEIRDSVGDFFNEINNKELSDLNLSELNHIYSASNAISSFTHSSVEGYSYTLPYIENNTYFLDELVPGVFAKTYWDKIHSEAGFVYDWNELSDNNVRFDKLFIPYSGDKKKLSEEFVEGEKVKVDKLGFTQSLSLLQLVDTSSNSGAINLTINENEIDPQNYYNTTTSQYTSTYTVNPPNKLDWRVKVDWELYLYNPSNFVIINGLVSPNTLVETPNGLRPRIQVFGSSQKGFQFLNPTQFATYGSELASSETNLIGQPAVYVDADKYINFKGRFVLSPLSERFVASGVNDFTIAATNININELLRTRTLAECRVQSANFRFRQLPSVGNALIQTEYRLRIKSVSIEVAPNVGNALLPGALLTMNRFIPKKIKQNEFIKSIIQKYNLYVEIDKFNPNKLIYKSRDYFYDSGEFKDWTYKLAKDREQILEFVPEIKNKRTILSYKDDDNDALLKAYKNETNETYGQIEVIFDNENTRGDERKDEIFSPTMNLWSNFGANLPILSADFKFNLRVLLHNGAKNCGTYFINESNNNIVSSSTYPFMSMLDEPVNPNFDISYGINDYYPYDIENFTSNNLYTNFWRRTFAQINSGKMMTAYFWLNEEDIFKLKLNDKIKINNALWYINKIIDYKANKNVLTKVELLSVEDDLRLPRFGRIVRPVRPGVLPPVGPGPVKPVGPIRPILDAVKDVIKIRNSYTSVEGDYKNSVNLGNGNVINSTAVVIGSNRIIDESGFYVDDTKLVNGGLFIDERTSISSEGGVNIGPINVGDEGITLNSNYIEDGYWDDDYVISGTTASFSFNVDPDTGETTINITGDNVLINGAPISGGSGATGATGATGPQGEIGPTGPAGSGVILIDRVTGNTFSVADYNLDVFLVGNGATAIGIYLPTANDGDKYTFKDWVGAAGTYPVTINSFSSDTIDGSSSYIMNINYQSITIVGYSGYGWYII